MSTISAKRNSKRIGNEPAATSPAAPASHPGGDSPESRSDDMNMMSKIYASTAMSPVEMDEQDTTPRTITLPLVTPGVSPALATLIEAYVDALNSFLSRGDDEADQDFDDRGLMGQIIAWPARSYADLAAKMALSLSELRGRVLMTVDDVEIEDDFALDLHAENLMITSARDARRLSQTVQASNDDSAITEAFETGLERMAVPIAGATASVAGRAEWDQAFAQHEEARAAATAFDEQVATPAYEAWRIAQEAVPHMTTTASFESEPGRRIHATTADRAIIGTARIILAELPELASADGDFARTCREAVAADDARQEELERLRLACGYDAAAHRQDELSELESESWKRLMLMPAPDGKALMWKMQELWGDEGNGSSAGWSMDIVEPVLADARRLLSA